MASVKIPVNFYRSDKRARKLLSRYGGRSAAWPVLLWIIAAEDDPETGRLANHSAETLERELFWTGRQGELEKALIDAGFLEKCEEGYQVINWNADQPQIWSNKQKASKAGKALFHGVTVEASSSA